MELPVKFPDIIEYMTPELQISPKMNEDRRFGLISIHASYNYVLKFILFEYL